MGSEFARRWAFKLDDDTPIEAGILTKSIENAQKKVEAHNYEQRKHVLEYDDVMNKQRAVIYAEEARRVSWKGTTCDQA